MLNKMGFLTINHGDYNMPSIGTFTQAIPAIAAGAAGAASGYLTTSVMTDNSSVQTGGAIAAGIANVAAFGGLVYHKSAAKMVGPSNLSAFGKAKRVASEYSQNVHDTSFMSKKAWGMD